MLFTLRDFQSSDKEQVQKLSLQLINHLKSIDKLDIVRVGDRYVDVYWDKLEDVLVKHQHKFLVAESNSKIIAYCVAILELPEEISEYKYEDILPIKVADIYDVCVDENWRGIGVGTCLLEQAEIWMRSLNCDYIWLQVLADNIQAKSLYGKLGYGNRLMTMMKKLT